MIDKSWHSQLWGYMGFQAASTLHLQCLLTPSEGELLYNSHLALKIKSQIYPTDC